MADCEQLRKSFAGKGKEYRCTPHDYTGIPYLTLCNTRARARARAEYQRFRIHVRDLPGFQRSLSCLGSRVSKPCKLEEKVGIEMLASCYGVSVRHWHFHNASPSPNIFIA